MPALQNRGAEWPANALRAPGAARMHGRSGRSAELELHVRRRDGLRVLLASGPTPGERASMTGVRPSRLMVDDGSRWRGPHRRHAARRRPSCCASTRRSSGMRGSPRCARRRAGARARRPARTEWAAVAMGKAEGRKLAGIDYSTPDRRTPDVLMPRPATCRGGTITTCRRWATPRSGRARWPKAARAPLAGLGRRARRGRPGGCVRLRRQRRPARAGAGRRRCSSRLSSRCAYPAGAWRGPRAQRPRLEGRGARVLEGELGAEPPWRQDACDAYRRRGRWSSSWRWWLDHEHAKAIRGTPARTPPGSPGERFAVSHDSTRRRRLGDHLAVLLPDGSASAMSTGAR